jgi:putative transposase
MTRSLAGRIVKVTPVPRRFRYPRTHYVLRPDFPGVNHKRLY